MFQVLKMFCPHRANKKRQYKNSKYGFGGQKKRSKMNTKESSADMSDFSRKVNQGKPGKQYTNKNKNKVSFAVVAQQ